MKNMDIKISVSDELDICVDIEQSFPPIPISFFNLEDAFEFIKIVVNKFKNGENPWEETFRLKKEYETKGLTKMLEKKQKRDWVKNEADEKEEEDAQNSQ